MNKKIHKLVTEIFSKCEIHNIQLVSIESCTGGLLAATLTEIPGSSKYFERGYVTYSNESKSDEVNVPKNLINKFGAVSREVVTEMAKNAIVKTKQFNQLSIAISGVAGPDSSENKPVGLVWLACSSLNKIKRKKLNIKESSRKKIRQISVHKALKLINRCLSEIDL